MLIDQLAKITGVPVKTLRQYENFGLLVADEGHEGEKQYHESHIHAIKMIKMAQSVGFTLREILTVLNSQAMAKTSKVEEALHMLEERRAQISSQDVEGERQQQIIDILKRELEGFFHPS